MQPGSDTTKPHSARVYDYYLGGKDHFAADRETVHEVAQAVASRVAASPAQARTAAEFAALAFRGLEMIDLGVVLVSEWRRPAGLRSLPAEVNWYGGIGRKTGRISA